MAYGHVWIILIFHTLLWFVAVILQGMLNGYFYFTKCIRKPKQCSFNFYLQPFEIETPKMLTADFQIEFSQWSIAEWSYLVIPVGLIMISSEIEEWE